MWSCNVCNGLNRLLRRRLLQATKKSNSINRIKLCLVKLLLSFNVGHYDVAFKKEKLEKTIPIFQPIDVQINCQ